jgi:hypothetical protein
MSTCVSSGGSWLNTVTAASVIADPNADPKEHTVSLTIREQTTEVQYDGTTDPRRIPRAPAISDLRIC